MPKKLVLSGILILSITSILFVLYQTAWSSTKHNVVIIVSDALRVDMLGCYGGVLNTPNIDWLARQGVLFENAYSTSPWTAPSAISMFTGNYPDIYRQGFMEIIGVKLPSFHIPDNDDAFGKILRRNQYKTLLDSENPMVEAFNNLQGFERVGLTETLEKKIRRNPRLDQHTSAYLKTHNTLSLISNHSADKPLFFVKWLLDPHSPYINPAIK